MCFSHWSSFLSSWWGCVLAKNNTWRILGCITLSNHWCLVADLLTHVFLFSQDFSTQFHFEHARTYSMSKVLDDPSDDPLIFFANHFAAFLSQVDLWNLIFQARIDFWIDFSNGFSWLNFFVGLIGIWRVPIWVQYIYFKRSVRQHRYLFWNFKTSTGCVLAKNQQKKLYWRSTKNFCCLNKKQQTSVVFSQIPHALKSQQEINETNIPQPTQPTQSQHWSLRNWLDFTVVLFSFMELLAASIPGSSTVTWVEQGRILDEVWCPWRFFWNFLGPKWWAPYLLEASEENTLVFFVVFFEIYIYIIYVSIFFFRPSFVHHSCV